MANDNFSGTIPFTINRESNTLEKTEMIGGLKWCAKVVLKSGEFAERYDMEFSICCEKDYCDQQQLWLTKAGIKIRTERRESSAGFGSSKKCLNLQFDQCFFNNNNSITKHWNCVLLERGEQKILLFEINVFRHIKSFIALDANLVVTCNSKENDDDEGKIAKKKVIAVNKNILAAISPHFAQLFSANWSEHQNGITIVEEEPEDVEAFQKIVYATLAMGWMMNVNDAKMLEEMLFCRSNNDDDHEKYNFALRILFLAIKYDLSTVGQFAEDYILEQLKFYRIPKFELYEKASKSALPEPGLKERILATVNGDDFSIAENLDIFMRLDAKMQHILVERVRSAGKKMPSKMTLDKKNDVDWGRGFTRWGWDASFFSGDW